MFQAVAVGLFMSLVSASALASDAAFTDYDKVVEAAFPSLQLARSYEKPDRRQEALLSIVREGILGLVQNAGTSWYSVLTYPMAASSQQVSSSLEAMRRTPVWLCERNCPCSSRAELACVVGKNVGDSLATVIYARKCLFSAGGCTRGSRGLGAELSQHLTPVLARIAAMKVHGASGERMAAAAERGHRALQRNLGALRSLASTCPGPFAEEGSSFLMRSGHMAELGGYAEGCALKLLEPLKASKPPLECRLAFTQNDWQRGLRAAVERKLPRIVRCDRFCQLATCGDPESSSPRLMKFGREWHLSLPEGTCEGARPTDPRAFLAGLIAGRASSRAPASSVDACAKALARGVRGASAADAPALPMERSGGGPEIELITD